MGIPFIEYLNNLLLSYSDHRKYSWCTVNDTWQCDFLKKSFISVSVCLLSWIWFNNNPARNRHKSEAVLMVSYDGNYILYSILTQFEVSAILCYNSNNKHLSSITLCEVNSLITLKTEQLLLHLISLKTFNGNFFTLLLLFIHLLFAVLEWQLVLKIMKNQLC